MKNFNAKQSGSEVILEEVNPHKRWTVITGEEYNGEVSNSEWENFTPLILTSIDPQIKVGQVIRKDQLEIGHQWYSPSEKHWYPGKQTEQEDIEDGYLTRQVAKLKQVDRVETPIQEESKIVGIPLSEITDEDLEYVKQFHPAYGDKWAVIYLLEVKLREGLLSYKAYQYLESKGYQMGTIPIQEHKPESEETTYTFKEMIGFVKWYSGMSQEKVVNAYNRYLVENKDLK